jgi:uncharacterized protein with PIN domain
MGVGALMAMDENNQEVHEFEFDPLDPRQSLCRHCNEPIIKGTDDDPDEDVWWHVVNGIAQTGCRLYAEPLTVTR